MPQSFFSSKLGEWVLRKDPVDSDFRTYQLSDNPKAAQYYHSLQDIGVQFKPILNVAQSENVCLSCEG